MTRFSLYSLIAVAALCVWLVLLPARAGTILEEPVAAPAFTHRTADEWINSKPLTLEELEGQVVLIDIWTFDCWNCYRSFPWLRDLESRLADEPFQVIGVHSPEFDHERVRSNIVDKVREFGLEHPVMIDNDFSYWKALNNRYWPTFYIVDKHGRLRAIFVGETHAGDAQAKRIEATIRELLREDTAG